MLLNDLRQVPLSPGRRRVRNVREREEAILMTPTVAAIVAGAYQRNGYIAPARRGGRVDFQALLAAFRGAEDRRVEPAARAAYTVKKGDTLSGICAAALREAGEKPTQAAILAATRRVAELNGLDNPDFIVVGQKLDLAAVPPARVPRDLARGGGTVTGEQGLLAALEKVEPEDGRTQLIVQTEARVSSRFGPRKNPFTGRPEFHSGVDIAAPRGSNVYPVRPGTVSFSGWQPGYGKVVIVSHDDGSETLYAHNARNLVRRGQRIGWGTPLGRVGSTGDSTGPHIHFELRKGGQPVNPAELLSQSLAGSVEVAKAL